MMKDNTTLTQLTTEMAQLQQQITQMNQRLDMIYGAITRLAETNAQPQALTAGPLKRAATPSSTAEMSFPVQALLNPGTMLASLHQHALKAGLTIPTDSLERLQADLPIAQVNDGDQ